MSGWTVVDEPDSATVRASRWSPRPDAALCGRGLHPWTTDNLYRMPSGVLRCRACQRLSKARSRERQRERRP